MEIKRDMVSKRGVRSSRTPVVAIWSLLLIAGIVGGVLLGLAIGAPNPPVDWLTASVVVLGVVGLSATAATASLKRR